MKKTYFIRKTDELGRIVLPIEIRQSLDIKEKDSLEICLKDDGVFLRKKLPFCIFCNSTKNLLSFSEKNLCENCFKKLKNNNSKE